VATSNTLEREFAAGGYDIAVRVTNLWGTDTETRRITVAP
jgi:hypothetical protein